jgi:hypothetical protein
LGDGLLCVIAVIDLYPGKSGQVRAKENAHCPNGYNAHFHYPAGMEQPKASNFDYFMPSSMALPMAAMRWV